jgi:hypothetical protein
MVLCFIKINILQPHQIHYIWKEEQFMRALREGKFKGLSGNRSLLPPMPWQIYRIMTDDEIKAIFTYLKTTKLIKNVVPPPMPPAAK